MGAAPIFVAVLAAAAACGGAGGLRDVELPCEHPTGLHADYEEYFEGGTPTGTAGDPLAVANAEIDSWFATEPGDRLVPVADEREVRSFAVLRGGEPVAVTSYRADGQGGWYHVLIEYCEPSG